MRTSIGALTRRRFTYEERLLTGRYVLTTSLTAAEASTTDVVRHYRMLQNVEYGSGS